MTADLIAPSSFRRSAPWAGRASQHRREQVCGPAADGAGMPPAWEMLVEVLDSLEAPASALLCTPGGAPVASHGILRHDLPLASRRTARTFAARALPVDNTAVGTRRDAVETVELTAGLRHIVIASVPARAQGGHLLQISAEGVSLPLLQAWTRRVAEDLRETLVVQEPPSSSSAAL